MVSVPNSTARLAFARALCVCGTVFVLVLGHALREYPAVSWSNPPWWSVTIALAALSLPAVAFQLGRFRVSVRITALLGVVCLLIATLPALLHRPGTAFLLLLGAVGWIAWVWTTTSEPERRRAPDVARAHASTWGALLPGLSTWLLAASTTTPHVRWPWLCALALLVIASALAAWLLLTAARTRSASSLVAWGLWIAGWIGFSLYPEPWALGSSCLALSVLGPALFARARPRAADRSRRAFWGILLDSPARFLVSSFALLVLGGTLLLLIPASLRDGQSLTLVDAMFTSTSAVCVTGLVVVDTPTVFAGFGQVALVVLIQLGGLGIMTFSTAALALLHRRPSLRHESAVADLVGVHGHQQVFAAVRRVLLVTGVSEALGAGVLTLLFLRHGDALGPAFWRGVFTAVSAFCNAGFALQTDNLVPYQTSPAVLHVVAALIIVGGLGPAVVVVVPSWLRHRPISLQARLALTTTLALLVAPTLAILAFEWDGPLGHLGFWDRIHNAWLQSATLRTAGFNSIGVEGLRPVTLAMMVALMFIGGSPGGTAGGVKTTTLAVLILAVTAALRSHSEIRIAGRRVAPVSVYRAAAVGTLSVFFLGLAVGALLLTQRSSPGTILFEAVSAFGTVGLSIGGTRDLDAVGKIIIMVCMFAGRVGPLSLLLWIADSPREDGWTLPEEQVATG